VELYYSPLACSLAARVVCLEGGLDVAMRRTDLATKRVDGDREITLVHRNAPCGASSRSTASPVGGRRPNFRREGRRDPRNERLG
jgi:hypothetical protein